MSKTDKTRPYWVKINDPLSPARREYHDHSRGTCDIEDFLKIKGERWRYLNTCGYDIPYYGWNGGFYSPAVGRWAKAEKKVREGGARAKLARDRHEMLKMSREDIEDYDVINPRHRHGVLWDW